MVKEKAGSNYTDSQGVCARKIKALAIYDTGEQ